MLRALVGLLLLATGQAASAAFSMESDGNLGPQLCLSAGQIIPKHVNALCEHDGLLIAGGIFNRVANTSAQHLAAFDPATDQWRSLGMVGPNTTLEYTRRHPDETELLGAVMALACPAGRDFVYVGGYFSVVGADGAVVAHNLARYYVGSGAWEPVSSGNSSATAGVRFGDGSPAFVKALSCVPGTGCDQLFVGGYFDTALNVTANSVALVDATDPQAATATPLLDLSTDSVFLNASGAEANGVSGIVNALHAFNASDVVLGGLFLEAGGVEAPYMLSRWTADAGLNCVLNQHMAELEICQTQPTQPTLCCETVAGPVSAILGVSEDSVLVGGLFVNTLRLDVTSTATDDDEEPFELGYQNLALLPLTGGEAASVVEGGPDGEVLALACADDACETVIAGGAFGAWETFAFESADELLVTRQQTLTGLDNLLQLSSADGRLTPAALAADLPGDGGASINAVLPMEMDGAAVVVVGGNNPDAGNVLRVGVGVGAADGAAETLPAAALALDDDEDECQPAVGAGFCCRAGSICPEAVVEVPCPTGWGYVCTPSAAKVCSAGYYCPTPGEELRCPTGSYCLTGAVAPTSCAWWEICVDPGLERPDKMSSLVLGGFVLGLLLFVLAGSFYIYIRYRRRRQHGLAAALGKTKSVMLRRMGSAALSSDDDESSGFMQRGSSSRSEDGGGGGDEQEERVDLAFRGLGVELADGRRILANVTGRLASGTVTAVMGPSGCGKSTFMSALSNRIVGGHVLGDVFVNGAPGNLAELQDLVGFVPQEDIMHRTLSVREVLEFQCHLKGDPALSMRQKRRVTSRVIRQLGLSAVQHSLIGSEEARGISGGQRKRVNVAMELMGSPKVLFLDEPTSGLDSTTTQELADTLRDLAHDMGLTIALVIHQPRIEVLHTFDKLILLAKGGHPVFLGPVADAQPHFAATIGSDCPNQTSPADWFLDSIALHSDGLVAAWAEASVSSVDLSPDGGGGGPGGVVLPSRRRAGLMRQTAVFFVRSLVQQVNTKNVFLMDNALLLFTGALIGILGMDERNQYQLASMTMGLTAVLSALRVFGSEQVIFWREYSSGINSFAYFIGKAVAHMPSIVVAPLSFLSLFYQLSFPSASLYDLYVILLCTQLSCVGLGYFISAVVSPRNAQVAGVVSALISTLFAGLNPTAASLGEYTFGRLGMALSYGRWANGALFICALLNIYKAGFETALGVMAKLGYVPEPEGPIYSLDEVRAQYAVLSDEYAANVRHLLYLYAAFSGAAYLAIRVTAMRRTTKVTLLMLVPSLKNLREVFQ